jgi:predicted transcriptional regulator
LATRQSVEEHLQLCEDAIRIAQEQYKMASMQEHVHDDQFTASMQELENAYNDIAKLALSCNGQQREQLHRMRLQLQQLQNEMILHDH